MPLRTQFDLIISVCLFGSFIISFMYVKSITIQRHNHSAEVVLGDIQHNMKLYEMSREVLEYLNSTNEVPEYLNSTNRVFTDKDMEKITETLARRYHDFWKMNSGAFNDRKNMLPEQRNALKQASEVYWQTNEK